MSKKRKQDGGIIYSTDPDFSVEINQTEEETPAPSEQQLKIRLDSKQRRGKVVTLVEGFKGRNADREVLGKKLKAECGSGGTVKEGVILVQGNYKDRIKNSLQKMGYKVK